MAKLLVTARRPRTFFRQCPGSCEHVIMIKIRSFIWIAALFGALSFQGSARADNPVKDAKKELKDDRKELKDDKKELKDDRKELRDARKKRRDEHMAEMRAKWGEILKKPGVKEEMRVHSRRMSRLRRIDKLAKEHKKPAVEKRAEAAMAREKARHQKKMEELKGGAAPAPSGGAK